MLTEVTMYRVVCDAEGCEASPQGNEFYAMWSPDGALDEMSYEDWWTAPDGRHLCVEHAPLYCDDCGERHEGECPDEPAPPSGDQGGSDE